MILKQISDPVITDTAELFSGSRSTAITHLLHKGYDMSEEFYQELSQDIRLVKDILEKIPNIFSVQRRKLVEIIMLKSLSNDNWVTKNTRDDALLQKYALECFSIRKNGKSNLELLKELSCMSSEMNSGILEKLEFDAHSYAQHSRIYFYVTKANDLEIKVTVFQGKTPTNNYVTKDRLREIVSEFLIPVREIKPITLTINPIAYL